MIQEPIMNTLKVNIPGLSWSVNNRTASDNTGTVYYDGGATPDDYELRVRYPNYQVYIRSSDVNKAANAAQLVFDLLHMKENMVMRQPIYKSATDRTPSSFIDWRVLLIEGITEPLRVGMNNGVMEYSLNFQATIIKMA